MESSSHVQESNQTLEADKVIKDLSNKSYDESAMQILCDTNTV